MKTKASGHTTKDTRIMACTCRHEYQDQRYGTGMRVHNPLKENKWGCTVCGTKKNG